MALLYYVLHRCARPHAWSTLLVLWVTIPRFFCVRRLACRFTWTWAAARAALLASWVRPQPSARRGRQAAGRAATLMTIRRASAVRSALWCQCPRRRDIAKRWGALQSMR
jgi:hypothetical protein